MPCPAHPEALRFRCAVESLIVGEIGFLSTVKWPGPVLVQNVLHSWVSCRLGTGKVHCAPTSILDPIHWKMEGAIDPEFGLKVSFGSGNHLHSLPLLLSTEPPWRHSIPTCFLTRSWSNVDYHHFSNNTLSHFMPSPCSETSFSTISSVMEGMPHTYTTAESLSFAIADAISANDIRLAANLTPMP